MDKPEHIEEIHWSLGTFEGNRIAQTKEIASRPFIERLQWACELSEVTCIRNLEAGKTQPGERADRYS